MMMVKDHEGLTSYYNYKTISRIGLLLVIHLALYSCSDVNNGKQEPNILLILTDNQSYYELSCNRHEIVKTPNIDKVAKQGVVFDNFYATPYCSPSRAELLTGRYSLRYGIHNTIGGVSILPTTEILISDLLKDAGYTCGVFGKWHLGNEYPYNPIYRGFDKSFIHDGGGIGQFPDYYGNTHIDASYNHNGKFVSSLGFSSDVLFHEAQHFIKENQNNPFFCFVSTPATHGPWQAHPEKLKELKKRGIEGTDKEMALYSMIENIDDNVGMLLSELDSLELTENTLVIIATDQGMRYRGLPNPPAVNNHGLPDDVLDFRHKVFCMMQFPKKQKQAYKSMALTGIVDIPPTIIDVCGLEVPANMDGRSLKPLLTDTKEWDDDRTVIVQCPRNRKRKKYKNASVKTREWRLLDGKLLFNAIEDPYQLEDVSAKHPQVVDSLNAIYNEFWESLPTEPILARHIIGAKNAPEIRLNAMDWYKGNNPHTQGQIPSKRNNGVWPVTIANDGLYHFELRSFPREHPKTIAANKTVLKIGESVFSKITDTEQEKVTFEVELKTGQYDLSTFFESDSSDENKKSWGANFVYINRIE
ncbi:sulfatase-like hydrolase/transferase [Saccharicrinis sp. 156]|uniref:sulfatase-like hydrolase/transferase n=1 Tax=Saccharicrinis sp. 156 TaxID=3417574 RepID=UPI003D33B77B